MQYLSSGGFGDALIVYLKLRQLLEPYNYRLNSQFIWNHVESNDLIKKPCLDFFGDDIHFECDPNYIKNYRNGKWDGYTPVSSGVDTFCPLKGETKLELKQPFLYESDSELNDQNLIILQCSAGAKNNRGWKINPLYLKTAIQQKYGYRVVIVGTDKQYVNPSDPDNLVGRQNINQVCNTITQAKMFIGLSGFLNYYACATRTKNIHLIESEEHDKRYYHPLWSKYTTGIKIGSAQEILAIIK